MRRGDLDYGNAMLPLDQLSQSTNVSSQGLQIDEEAANAGNDPNEETFRPRAAGMVNAI